MFVALLISVYELTKKLSLLTMNVHRLWGWFMFSYTNQDFTYYFTSIIDIYIFCNLTLRTKAGSAITIPADRKIICWSFYKCLFSCFLKCSLSLSLSWQLCCFCSSDKWSNLLVFVSQSAVIIWKSLINSITETFISSEINQLNNRDRVQILKTSAIDITYYKYYF